MPADAINHFKLEKSVDGGPWTVVSDSIPAGDLSTTLADNDVAPVRYRVTEITDQGIEDLSNTVLYGSPFGTLNWFIKTIVTANGITDTIAPKVIYNSTGGLYALMRIPGSASIGINSVTGKAILVNINSTGTTITVTQLAPASTAVPTPLSFVVTIVGIFIVGSFTDRIDFGNDLQGAHRYFDSPINGVSGFVAKYTSSLQFQWGTSFTCATTSSVDNIVFESSTLNLILSCTFDGTITINGTDNAPVDYTSTGSSDILLVKLTQSGQYVRVSQFGTAGLDRTATLGLAIDSLNRTYIVGLVAAGTDFGGGPAPSSGYMIARFSSPYLDYDGFQQFIAGSNICIATDSLNGFILAGNASGITDLGNGKSINPGGMFLAHFNTDAVCQWVNCFNNSIDGFTENDVVTSISINSFGNIFIVGKCPSRCSFDGSSYFNSIKAFLASFSSIGYYRYISPIYGSGDLKSITSVASTSNNVSLSSTFSGTMNYGSSNITAEMSGVSGIIANYKA